MKRQISVGWRSGSAGALQAQGRGFKSLTDHHKNQARAILLWPVLIPNPLWGHVRGYPFYFSKDASVSGFGKRGSAPLSMCSAGRGRPSVQRRQGQGVRAAQAKTGPSYPCFQQISGPCRPFPTNSRHRAKNPSRMSCNRVCDDIGLTAGSASGGQNSGLCIGAGQKSGLCIGPKTPLRRLETHASP